MGRAKKVAVIGKLRLIYPKGDYNRNKEKYENKAFSIIYEYNYDRKTIKRNAPYKARVKDWDETANSGRGGLRRSYGDDYIRDTNRMLNYLSTIDNRIRDYADKHPNKLNPDIIHSLLYDESLTRQDEGKDFVEFVKRSLETRYEQNDIKHSRYENGVSGMNIFKEFLKSTNKGTYKPDSIYLGEINGDIIDDYISYRKNIKNNQNATINHALTPIIIACEQAVLKHYINDDVYNEIKIKRLKEDAGRIDDEGFDGKFLTKEQLQLMVDFYNSDTESRRKEYIEMFLFAFHAAGLRLVDVMTLQWKHINFENKELKKVLIKTLKNRKERNSIPLTSAAIQILTKWKNKRGDKRFVFDLIDDETEISNQEKLYLVRNSVNKKVNQALKVVGIKMGLPFTLTFHCARHSFAINALNDKEHPLDMYQVSRLLGHASTETTEKVYADYVVETLSDKLNDLNFNFMPNLTDTEESNS